jgi:hypothetical protein
VRYQTPEGSAKASSEPAEHSGSWNGVTVPP